MRSRVPLISGRIEVLPYNESVRQVLVHPRLHATGGSIGQWNEVCMGLYALLMHVLINMWINTNISGRRRVVERRKAAFLPCIHEANWLIINTLKFWCVSSCCLVDCICILHGYRIARLVLAYTPSTGALRTPTDYESGCVCGKGRKVRG